MPLPKFIKKYFWDINPKKAKPKSYPEYYIKRILEYGDKQAFEWIKRVFGTEKIKKVVKSSKLSPKDKNFWGRMLD